MACRIEAISMTWSHLQGHYLRHPFQTYSSAAVDKISTDIAGRAVSLL